MYFKNWKDDWKSKSIKLNSDRDLNSAKMHFARNFEIPTSIGVVSYHGQAQNGVIF